MIFFCRLPAVSGCAAAGYVPPGRCAVPCPLRPVRCFPASRRGCGWILRGRRADSPEHPIVFLSRNRRVGVLGDFLSGVSPPPCSGRRTPSLMLVDVPLSALPFPVRTAMRCGETKNETVVNCLVSCSLPLGIFPSVCWRCVGDSNP